MNQLEIIKIVAYCYSVVSLGILGMWWNNDDAPNRFMKTFVLTLFFIGTVIVASTIKTGIVYNIGFYSIEVASGALSIMFLFAKGGNNFWTTMFKLTCLINVISAIIFFSI